MNNFEYVGSGIIRFSGKAHVVVQVRGVYVKIYKQKSLDKPSPESTYSYYFSRFRNIVLTFNTLNTFPTFFNHLQYNTSGGI